MSNKSRKFNKIKSNNNQKRVVRRMRFDRRGHLINTILQPENSSILERNLNDADSFIRNELFEEVEEFVSKDEEFNEACENTLIIDDNGKEVSAEAQKAAHRQIVHQGTEDALQDVIENTGEEYTKESFFERATKNILDRFDFLRSNAEKDDEKTQKNEGSSLFGRFSKKVKVYASDVLSMFEADKKATQAYEEKIANDAPTIKSKTLWNKVKQHKYKIAAGFASVVLFAACTTSTNKKEPEQKVNQTTKTVKSVKPAPAPAPKQEVKADTVVVQTEYSDSLQISKVAWERTKSFFGDKYELANKRLTDQIMKEHFDSLTRESVLNQIAYNLTSYSDATICSWEEALNSGKAKTDKDAQKKVKAYRVAELLFCYLTAQNNTMPENLSDLFIAQKIGDKIVNVNVVNRTCGELKIEFKNIQPNKKSKEVILAPADTTVTQKDFVAGGGSVEIKNQNVQNDSIVGANFTYNKSNEAFKADKELRDANANEVLGRQAKDKTIMVEVASKDASANGSSATYNKGNDLDNGKVIKNATNEEATAAKVADKDIMLEQTDAKQTGFKDLTGEAKNDSVAAPAVAQTGFKDLTGEAKNDSVAAPAVAQTGFKDLTDETKNDSVAAPAVAQTGFKDLTGEKKAEKVVVADSTSYDVVMGTDGVPLGAPALGNIAPRGGHNHTDVSVSDTIYAEKILGKEVYNLIIENTTIHKELRANGGILGGLTPQESAVAVAIRTQVFPYSETTSALRKAVICGDTLSAEMAARVRADIENINANHTIDGVVYNQKTNTISVKHNGCDKKPTVNIEHVNVAKVTNPSGPKLPKMFEVLKNVQKAFGVGGGSVEYVTLPQDIVNKASAFTYNKSNEGFKQSMKLSDVDGSKVFGRKPKDKTIMVEVSSTTPARGVATYNKSNEGFKNSQEITTVSVDEAADRKPQNKKVYVEQEITQQAIVQKKMNTQS